MSSKIFTTLLLFAFAVTVAAQETITIKLNDETGEGVVGAAIKLMDSEGGKGHTTLTDADGKATLTIARFPAQMEVSSMGYVPFTKTINQKPSGTLNMSMDKGNTGLNEVIVTGVGRPTKVDQAVSLYRIVTKEEIRAQGAVTLNDAIRNQLGLNIGNDPALGATISMRGLSGNNVKILIDGLPLNGREAGNIDMSQINMSNIERVEMVQGPMSIMYGSDALGGVINLITKTNQQSSSFGANAFYETIGKYNLDVNGNIIHKKHNFGINIGRNFFQGWDPEDKEKRNPLWRPKELYFANFKYTYKISDNATISYALDISKENLYLKGSADELSYLKFYTKDEEFNTTRFINRIIATWKTGNSGFWQSNNSFAVYDRQLRSYNMDLTTMNRTELTSIGSRTSTRFNDLTSRTTYNNKVGILNYTVGYDVNISMASGVDKLASGEKTIGDYAAFLSADIEAFSGFKIQPAVRATYNSAYPAPLIPSLAILYKPTKKLSLRASYANGFRAPTLKELYLDFKDNNHDIVGNPNLKSETGQHFQLSAGYNLYSKERRSITTSLTGFYDDARNQISLALGDLTYYDSNGTQPPPYVYTNIGRSRFFVMQWRNDVQWHNLDFVFGGSYNKSIATPSFSDGVLVSQTPDFHYFEGNAQLTYKLPKYKAGISLFYKYTGSQPRLTANIDGTNSFEAVLKDFHNIDASINKQFWKNRLLVTVGVRNLTNNVIVNYAGGGTTGGGAHGGGVSGGAALTPGRSGFATVSLLLGK